MINPGYLETVFAVLRSRPDILERLDPGLTDAEVMLTRDRPRHFIRHLTLYGNAVHHTLRRFCS